MCLYVAHNECPGFSLYFSNIHAYYKCVEKVRHRRQRPRDRQLLTETFFASGKNITRTGVDKGNGFIHNASFRLPQFLGAHVISLSLPFFHQMQYAFVPQLIFLCVSVQLHCYHILF